VPACLAELGLNQDQLGEHIAWDIGAEQLARRVADLLAAPLVLQRYSRLVIDCNRPPGTPESIPVESDGTPVTANFSLTERERQARESEIFAPLDRAIVEGLDACSRQAVFSVHSFTPQMQGKPRPWHAGFLTRQTKRVGEKFVRYIEQQRPDMKAAVNEPYFIEDATDWFIPQHAEPRGLTHGLIEIRNDQLQDGKGIDNWAELLAGAIQFIMDDS